MTAPYYQDESVTLHHGDAREVLPTLPAGSVNCVVTSPPYYGLRDYGIPDQIGLEQSPAEYVETLRGLFGEVRRVLADDGVMWLNLGDSYQANAGNNGGYSDKSTLVGFTSPNTKGRQANEARRAVRIASDVGPKNMLGIPWRVAFALQGDGWTLRNAIVWHKPNAMPESVTDRLSTRYEHVFLFSKSRRYWFDLDAIREPVTSTREAALTWDRPLAKERDIEGVRVQKRPGRTWDERKAEGEPMRYGTAGQQAVGKGGFVTDELGRNPGDVWTIPTSPFPGAHFACMPLALAERCIAAGCKPGGTVLDPFSGSGTTGLAAARHGHRYIGIDANREYLDLSLRTRLAQPGLIADEAVS